MDRPQQFNMKLQCERLSYVDIEKLFHFLSQIIFVVVNRSSLIQLYSITKLQGFLIEFACSKGEGCI